MSFLKLIDMNSHENDELLIFDGLSCIENDLVMNIIFDFKVQCSRFSFKCIRSFGSDFRNLGAEKFISQWDNNLLNSIQQDWYSFFFANFFKHLERFHWSHYSIGLNLGENKETLVSAQYITKDQIDAFRSLFLCVCKICISALK